MSGIGVVTGCGVLSAAGDGLRALAARTGLARQGALAGAGQAAMGGRGTVGTYTPVADRFDDLPCPSAPVVTGFDVRARLGRKGTSTFDRATALAVVACGQAIDDAHLDLAASDRSSVGVVLGTTTGSLRSTMSYSRETLVAERPYLVNPMLFPNTVMNCAAGQAAIWFGLHGVNTTIAGGPLAFLQAMRYALGALERGHAQTLLVGAVEEYTPETAWSSALTDGCDAGEAVAVFVVERGPGTRRPRTADVLATATAFCPSGKDGDVAGILAGCVRQAVTRAGVAPADVVAHAAGGAAQEPDAVAAALGHQPRSLLSIAEFGDCRAASGGLALAAVLGWHWHGDGPDGAVSLLTGRSRDGAVMAAVVRGWRDDGAHRG
ncbi:MAG TPA: beta-ketoacyl synthase N-terminal-like domain-containing protein [Streptosporangiaceae bacterium]|nr:beta-ketoacyl synthase N-terminal-like domain-containing protein [Streptosporangiaceae bacterium]